MNLSSDMDVEVQGEKLLRDAFQNTVDAMENSKGQIFEIYENNQKGCRGYPPDPEGAEG